MRDERSSLNQFTTGGTVQAGSGLYIPRRADDELFQLCRTGTFAYVLTARQMGKSSLMVRTAERLGEVGVRSVIIDLTQIGAGQHVTAEQWYLGQLDEIAMRLGLDTDVLTWWENRAHLSMAQRVTEFFEEVLLREIAEPVVIFIDEIDTTLRLDFTDDFYAAIRYLYNARSKTPELKRLSFVLIGVASPGDLIHNPDQTPFNIGQRVELTDFTFAEASQLLAGFSFPADHARQVLEWIMEWTGGHPYLTQRLCRVIAEENRETWTRDAIGAAVDRTFFGEDGQRDNNLQFVRDMLTVRAGTLAGVDPADVLLTYLEVRRGRRPVADEEQSIVKSHLKLSGIVCRRGGVLEVRNEIYRRAFDEEWARKHLPVTWTRRQLTRARGALVGTAIALVVIGGLGLYADDRRRAANKRGEDLEVANEQIKIQRDSAIAERRHADRAREEAENHERIAQERLTEIEGKNREIERQKVDLERQRDLAAQQRNAATRYSQELQANYARLEHMARLDSLFEEGNQMVVVEDYGPAISTFRELLAHYRAMPEPDSKKILATLERIAEVYQESYDVESAITYYDSLASFSRSIGDTGRMHRALFSAAQNYEEGGWEDDAMKMYDTVLNAVERHKANADAESPLHLRTLQKLADLSFSRYQYAIPWAETESYYLADTTPVLRSERNSGNVTTDTKDLTDTSGLNAEAATYYRKGIGYLDKARVAHRSSRSREKLAPILEYSGRIIARAPALFLPDSGRSDALRFSRAAFRTYADADDVVRAEGVLNDARSNFTYNGWSVAAIDSEVVALYTQKRADSRNAWERTYWLARIADWYADIDPERAFTIYDSARAEFAANADRTWEANMLAAMGLCKYEEYATDAFFKYVALSHITGMLEPDWTPLYTSRTDELLRDEGVADQLELDVEKQVTIARQAGDNVSVAQGLITLGLLNEYRGNPDAARAAYDNAHQAYQLAKDTGGQAVALVLAAKIEGGRSSLERLDQALSLFRNSGNTRFAARVLMCIGNRYTVLSEYDSAVSYFEEARRLFAVAGDSVGIAYALWQKAETLRYMPEQRNGRMQYNVEATSWLSSLREGEAKKQWLQWIGDIYWYSGEQDKASEYYEHSFELRDELDLWFVPRVYGLLQPPGSPYEVYE